MLIVTSVSGCAGVAVVDIVPEELTVTVEATVKQAGAEPRELGVMDCTGLVLVIIWDGGERTISGVGCVAVVVSIPKLEVAEVRLGLVAWDGSLAHAL